MSKIHIGTRAQVYDGTAYKTTGGLQQKDLMKKGNRIVKKGVKYNTSRKFSEEDYRREPYGRILLPAKSVGGTRNEASSADDNSEARSLELLGRNQLGIDRRELEDGARQTDVREGPHVYVPRRYDMSWHNEAMKGPGPKSHVRNRGPNPIKKLEEDLRKAQERVENQKGGTKNRKRQKGGLVPTGKTIREARERRRMIARIQEEERLDNLFPDPPGGPQGSIPAEGSNDSIGDLEGRLAALRDLPDDLNRPPQRRGSLGDRPLYNSGFVTADHPRQQDQRPLRLEEMNIDLNLPPQRRGSIGGIKKRKSRRHKKQTKSRRKSKHSKKKRTRRHVNKKLKRKSYSRRR